MALRFIPVIHRITHRIGLSIQGVSQGEAHILAHLASAGVCTIAELHRALGHKRSTLTSILDRLTERKWLVRRTSESDRRSFVIALTPTGRVRARKVLRHLEALERELEKSLTSEERRRFVEILTKMTY
jgi:DNA-binding MarR family transcriptional regulator